MANKSEQIRRVRQAARQTFGPGLASKCAECGDAVGPKVIEVTEKYCADCYIEIEFGMVSRQRGGIGRNQAVRRTY